MKKLGLYIHTPFCFYKCPYCDFYSVKFDKKYAEEYVNSVCEQLQRLSANYGEYLIDTVYFGGGTPNLLGNGLVRILDCIREFYNLDSSAEITTEANPFSADNRLIESYAAAGVNRFSFGMQSADAKELKMLGRRHTNVDVKRAVDAAKYAGCSVSVDVMLGIPGQTKKSLKATLDFVSTLDADHISAYILKIEEATPFYRMYNAGKLAIPDDDSAADLYLLACDELAKQGYLQYEVSNFAKPGFESRHNLKYWKCEEYLGIGPSAHSFVAGKRFYYPDSVDDFMKSPKTEFEGTGGDISEYVMLKLRLREGLEYDELRAKYPDADINKLISNASKIPDDYIFSNEYSMRFSQKGFLISNSLIEMILDDYLP